MTKAEKEVADTAREIQSLLAAMSTYGKSAEQLRQIATNLEIKIEGDSGFALARALSDAAESRINTSIWNLSKALRITFSEAEALVNTALGF